MEWQIIVAMLVAIPVILFPAAFVWYLNVGGIYASIKERRRRKAALREVEGMVKSVPVDQVMNVVDGVNELTAGIHAVQAALEVKAGEEADASGFDEVLKLLQASYEMAGRANALESSVQELTQGVLQPDQEADSEAVTRPATARL